MTCVAPSACTGSSPSEAQPALVVSATVPRAVIHRFMIFLQACGGEVLAGRREGSSKQSHVDADREEPHRPPPGRGLAGRELDGDALQDDGAEQVGADAEP